MIERKSAIRYGWLRAMYIWTVLGAGGFGLAVLLVPEAVQAAMGYPAQDPMFFGVVACVYVAFGLLSVLGYFSPLKYAPVLLLQLGYKSLWFLAVLLPAAVAGSVPTYGWGLAAIFATYVIGDLIALPFPTLLERERPGAAPAAAA
ncbi:MAG: hypothetical protein GXY82_10260 [Methanospirillum sp.]|nr:hypothetical protein [Methanospirillum sp.]